MKRLTLSDGLIRLFRPGGEELELSSPGGDLVGHFVPVNSVGSGGACARGSTGYVEPRRVVVDEALRRRLCGLTDSLELLDDSGHVIGHFLPVQDRAIYEGVDSPTDPEELLRRASEPGGRTWAEIRADLERLA